MNNQTHLHYYLDLLRDETYADCGYSLTNIINTWKAARNGVVKNENFDGIDLGEISLNDINSGRKTDNKSSYKSRLHYYLDLLREEPQYKCGYSLMNIINTWKLARNNVICGENFDCVDFGNVPLNGIKFSEDGKMPSSFRHATLNEYNFVSGHSWNITCLAFSFDDYYIITCGRDCNAIVWETSSGLIHAKLEGHNGIITSVAIYGDYCLTGSTDNTAKIWLLQSGECIHTLKEHTKGITSVAIHGDYCLTGSADNTAKIWLLQSGQCVHTLKEHTKEITSVSLCNNYCLTGSKDKTAKLWSVTTGQCLFTYKEHTGEITCVAISTLTNNYCLTGSSDGTAKLWSVQVDKSIYTFQEHTHRINSIAFSSHEDFCVTGSLDSTAKIWDIKKGICNYTLNEHKDAITSTYISNNNLFCVTSSRDGTAKIWSIETGKCKFTLNDEGWINVCALSYNNLYCVTARAGIAKIWNVDTGKYMYSLIGYTSTIISTTISNNKKYCLIADFNGIVRLWEIKTGLCIYTFNKKTASSTSIAISSDSKYCLLITFCGDVEVYYIGKKKCYLIYNFFSNSGFVKEAAFINQDKLMIIDGYGIISIYCYKTGERIKELGTSNGLIPCASISHECNYCLIRNGYNYVELWDTNNEICRKHNVEGSTLLTFSDSSSYYLIGWNKTIYIYSTFNHDFIQLLHVDNLNTCKKIFFINDTKLLLIYDNHIDIIDIVDFDYFRSISTGIRYINEVSISYDKTICLFGLMNGSAILYDINMETVIDCYYDISDVNISNCDFSYTKMNQNTEKILYQYHGLIGNCETR